MVACSTLSLSNLCADLLNAITGYVHCDIMYQGTAYVGCNSGGFKLYRSDDVFSGVWEHVTQIDIGVWAAGTHAEDPYTWMDAKGRWHLLAHRWDYKDGFPVNPQQTMPVLVAGHGYSLDGIDWHFNVAEQPYNPWVTFVNGTQQNYSTYV